MPRYIVTKTCYGFLERLWDEGTVVDIQNPPANLPKHFELQAYLPGELKKASAPQPAPVEEVVEPPELEDTDEVVLQPAVHVGDPNEVTDGEVKVSITPPPKKEEKVVSGKVTATMQAPQKNQPQKVVGTPATGGTKISIKTK